MRTENYPAETEVPSLGPRLHNIPAFARRIIFKKVYDALRSLREPRTGHRRTARSRVGHRSPAGKHRVELFLHTQEFHLQAGRASLIRQALPRTSFVNLASFDQQMIQTIF
jgi:hypothetical protein